MLLMGPSLPWGPLGTLHYGVNRVYILQKHNSGGHAAFQVWFW